MRRKLVPGIAYGAAHAVAALADARIRQSDHREAGQTERYVDLDLNRTGLHAEQRRGSKAGQHDSPALQTACAATASCFQMLRRRRADRVGYSANIGRVRHASRCQAPPALPEICRMLTEPWRGVFLRGTSGNIESKIEGSPCLMRSGTCPAAKARP